MSYIGNEPIVSATRTITEIVATAGQTVFVANGGYTVGFIDVFVNGAQLQTSDFTATNGSTITLNSPASTGDDIRLVAWGTFSTANTNGASLVDGTVTPAKLSQKLTSGTAVASTSGTSIDFTGIPSWAKRITVMFNGVSTNGSAAVIVQIGSGSITSSGYTGRSGYIINSGASSVATVTNGFALDATGSSTEVRTGIMVIALQTANTYISSCQVCSTGSAVFGFGNGIVTLSGALDRVRVTTGNGTDIFDAGSINILYE